ncbi:MAG: rane protein of uknown function [Acidimicrobiaceae bacterium]|nr:rane protein of uknown function [Acidimicrobiaceae bacterium]
MADLIAIGYPDEHTAGEAAREAERLAADFVIEPDQIAVIRRDQKGRYHVTTTHHEVASGATFGLFWGLLFGVLFFIPVLGMVVGAGLGALTGLFTKLDIDSEFQQQVRDTLQPGTSALFLVVEKITSDKAIEALARFGGTVLKTSLPKDVEQEIQEALHGAARAS